jgi:shikimate dehydrogenase
MKITSKTKLCAVIGKPIGHSVSPVIHNAGYRELALDYVYLAFEANEVGQAIAAMRELDIRGLSVTIPHKIDALAHCDQLDSSAQELGALNTIVNEAGRLIGYNTDGPAAIRLLERQGVNLRAAKVVMLGAGGAGLALSLSLVSAGTRELVLVEEDMERCKGLSERELPAELQLSLVHCADDSLQERIKGADLLINCTPVGMHPKGEGTPVPREMLHEGLTVFDLVYNPRPTRLLSEAAAAGARTMDGLAQLVEQAALQFKLFTGQEPPRGVMMQAAERAMQAAEAPEKE